jgi:hypothetical protein
MSSLLHSKNSLTVTCSALNAECHYASIIAMSVILLEYNYAECLSVKNLHAECQNYGGIVRNVFALHAVTVRVVILSVIILGFIILNVMAPSSMATCV